MKNAVSYLILIGLAVGLVLLVRCGVRNADGIAGGATTGSGGPYTAKIIVGQRGRNVSFLLDVRDGDGRKCRTIRLPSGKKAPLPKVVVRDAEDHIVHTGRFAYG